MITTAIAKPLPALAPYIQSYNYREFNTFGFDVTKPKHAVNELWMDFFFKGVPVKLIDAESGAILKTGKRSGISGMSSQFVGEMTFNGFYSFFQILFKPHGFQTLFNIPSTEVLNKIAWSEELFDGSIDLLHEQLCYCKDVYQMGAVADTYLLKQLKKQKLTDNKNRISHIVNSIDNRKGLINIDALASDVNMSVRNFERHFSEHIGIPPKLYCCISRFNHALDFKLRNPHRSWTSVAHEVGYFDQMHLIKDFKKFSGDAPSVLLKETPLLVETYNG